MAKADDLQKDPDARIKNLLTIFLAALLVGGGLFFWQSAMVNASTYPSGQSQTVK